MDRPVTLRMMTFACTLAVLLGASVAVALSHWVVSPTTPQLARSVTDLSNSVSEVSDSVDQVSSSVDDVSGSVDDVSSTVTDMSDSLDNICSQFTSVTC